MEQLSFMDLDEKSPQTTKGIEAISLNKRQIDLIREKVTHTAGDYCKVTAPILEEYLNNKGVKFRKRSAKGTLVKLIENQGLFEDFCTYAYQYIYVSPYDLEDVYHITRDQAIKIAQLGVLETDGAINSKGYTMFTLKALEYSKEDLLNILINKLGDTQTQFRIVVASKERGQEILEEMGQIYDIENVSAYIDRKRDKDGYSLYFTTSKKGGRGNIHKENENARLKAEVALLREELLQTKEELRALKTEEYRETCTTEAYKKIDKELKDMRLDLAATKQAVRLKDDEIKDLKNKLDQVSVGRPRKFNTEDEDQIVEMKQSGLSMQKIAEELKCSVGLVHKVLKNRGIAGSRQQLGAISKEIVLQSIQSQMEGNKSGENNWK